MASRKILKKFYVDSGNLRYVCLASSELAAIKKTMKNLQGSYFLGPVIRVNEQGFQREHKNDIHFCTLSILQKFGLSL